MADLSKTIEIVFAGVDHTGAALSSVGRGLKDVSDKARDITQPMANVTAAIVALDVAAAALAVKLGTTAVREATKFADSMYLVQKQLGDQGPGIEVAREAIEGLARQYGTNANDVAQSMAGFLAAGNDYANSAGLVETATRLMIAGDLDATTATDAITRSLSGFRVPADQAAEGGTKVGDVLNKIGDISSGAFTEIVQGFARIAPTARDAGLSMEETAAWTAVLVDKFGSGEIAATALKSGLLSLLDPSKDGREALAELGVATTDSSGNLRLAKDIMADLSGATGRLTESQRLQTAAVIFGKDQAGAMNALLGDWGTGQRYVAQMLDQTTGATGSMSREVQGKLQLMSTAIAQADESWRQLLEHLGRQITAGNDLQGLVTAVGGLGTALRKALDSGAFDALLTPLRARFAALAQLVDGIAAALPEALGRLDWSPVLAALGELEDGFSGLFGDLDLTKPEDLAKALQSIVDGAGSFIEVSQGIYAGLAPIFTVIGSLVTGFAALSPELQSAVGYFLGISTAVNLVAGPVGTIGTAIRGLGSIMAGASLAAGGLVAALVAVAAYDVTKIVQIGSALAELPDQWRAQADAQEHAAQVTDQITAVLAVLNERLGLNMTSVKDLDQAQKDGLVTQDQVQYALDKVRGKVDEATAALDPYDEQVRAATAAENAQLLTKKELTAQFNELSAATAGTKDKLEELTTATAANADGVTEMVFRNGRWVEMSPALQAQLAKEQEASKKSADALAEETKKREALNKVSTEFLLGWEKIQAEQRTAVFKLQAEIDIAKIQADAQKTVAAYDMMTESFSSTQAVLSDLFGLWADANTNSDKDSISRWIEREYAIREKLAQSQSDMIDAQIAKLKAETEMMARGGLDLRITSDGLEPDLQAFMFRIIDKVRVSVAGSYSEFLLGVSG